MKAESPGSSRSLFPRRMAAIALCSFLLAMASPLSGAGGRILVYPNPFDAKKAMWGTVKFEGVPVNATVRVYTVTSIVVREMKPPHAGVVEWDGRNENGFIAAKGIYVWSVEGGGVSERGILVVE